MAVVTEAFDIPMDIMTKLATGEYRRLGGVVRVAIGPNKGQIVKHLDPIKIEQVAQNKNGRDTRSDKKIGTIRKEAK